MLPAAIFFDVNFFGGGLKVSSFLKHESHVLPFAGLECFEDWSVFDTSEVAEGFSEAGRHFALDLSRISSAGHLQGADDVGRDVFFFNDGEAAGGELEAKAIDVRLRAHISEEEVSTAS